MSFIVFIIWMIGIGCVFVIVYVVMVLVVMGCSFV